MEKLEQHYFNQARQGIVLSVKDLQEYCKQSSAISPKPTVAQLTKLRYRWKYIALHARWKKPPHYVGSSIDRLGNIFVDVGIFKQNLAVQNKQRYILLVGTDLLSQKISCIAFPNKSQQSWEKGLVQMIEKDFPVVRCFVTDRDTAISGEAFQKKIKTKYGVDWVHLRNRSKSFAAERVLRYLKDRLSTALSLNDKGDNRWLSHLDTIVADYNQRLVKGTNIRRQDATKANQMKLLAQKFKVKDFEPIFNTSVVGNFSKRMFKAIGSKYIVGSKVLLSRSANYNLKSDAFTKKSELGSYGKKVYTVTNVFLKSNSKHFYSLMYKLKGMEGIFYSTELIPALFSEEEGAPDEDLEDRKKKAAKAKKRRQQS